MQRSRTRYAPPRSLAAPAGPAQATSACLQPARADGIAQQGEKETGGSGSDEVETKRRAGMGSSTSSSTSTSSPLAWPTARCAPAGDYGMTLLLTT